MYHPQNDRDQLRARFTVFLEKMVLRARLNYLEKIKREKTHLSLEDISELPDPSSELVVVSESDFQFEEERLAKAFATLPLMRKRILSLLFVEELTPQEIANRLHCSVGHVYNQRSLSLKLLRELLKDGDSV